MTDQYTFDPDAWPPALAGLVAGALGAIVAAIIGAILTASVVDQPHDYANSLSVVIISLVLGWISGMLWHRLRAADGASKVFAWTLVGAFVATLSAVLIVDQTVLKSLAPWAIPLAIVIFITLAFFTPLLSRAHAPQWTAAIPVVIALGIGFGLFL